MWATSLTVALQNTRSVMIMDSYDYSIDEMTKILVYLMKYGVRISDEDILLIAGSFFNQNDKNC